MNSAWTGRTILLVAMLSFGAGAMRAVPAIQSQEISSPAAVRSVGGSISTAPDGTIWLSWVEPSESNTPRFSRFDRASNKWPEARTIVTSKDVTSSSGDFPQVALDGAGRSYAVWTDGHGGALSTYSADGGESWSAPKPW